jgi:SH3 domain protein
MKTFYRVAVLCSLFAIQAAWAAPAWVTDQFEITLRSGPSTSNAIQLMINSGTQLEVLERDAESGYSRVRTAGGTEGWVVSRYLMNERSAREQLERLSSQLTDANSRGTSLGSQLTSIKDQYEAATARIATLESEKAALEQELAEIKRTAANVLAINDQNESLMEQLSAAQIHGDTLEQENRQLAGQSTRYWFMTGAVVLVVGIILGIWLPRIRWQRRSRYDRF